MNIVSLDAMVCSARSALEDFLYAIGRLEMYWASDLSWLIVDKVRETCEGNNISFRDLYDDSNEALRDQLVSDMQARYGCGPHDINEAVILVNDRVVIGHADGNTSRLIVGTVLETKPTKVKILVEKDSRDDTGKEKWYIYPRRMMKI